MELDAAAQSDFDDLKLKDKQRAGKEVLEDLAQTKNPVEQAAWKQRLMATTSFQQLSSEESRSGIIRRARTQLTDKGILSFD